MLLLAALLTTYWFQVLEPNWHAMYNRLQNAKSLDKVWPSSTFPADVLFLSQNLLVMVYHYCNFNFLTLIFLEQVIQHYDFFLDKCLRECLLLLPKLLKVCFDTRLLILEYHSSFLFG